MDVVERVVEEVAKTEEMVLVVYTSNDLSILV